MWPEINKIYLKFGGILAVIIVLSSFLALVFSDVIGQNVISQIAIEAVIQSLFSFILGYKAVRKIRKISSKQVLPSWLNGPFWEGATVAIYAHLLVSVVVFALTKKIPSQGGGLIIFLFSGWGGLYAHNKNEEKSAKTIKVLTVISILIAISIFVGKFQYGVYRESHQAEVWKEYIYAEDNFKISSPIPFSLKTNEQSNDQASVVTHIYSADNMVSGESYTAYLYKYSIKIHKSKSKQLFDAIIQDIIKTTPGMSLVSTKEEMYDTHPAIEYQLKLEKDGGIAYFRGKIILTDTNIYSLIFGSPEVGAPKADKFFNSFTFIQNPAPNSSQ